MSEITTAFVGTATIVVNLEFVNPNDYSNCTAETCSIVLSFYNYRINIIANAFFLAFFSLSFMAFLSIWIITRRGIFFAISMLLGLLLEIIGYAGRVMSYENQWSQQGFLMQIVCITLGPTLFSAAIYVCLGHIVMVYGSKNSRIPPLWYTRIVSLNRSLGKSLNSF